MVNQVKVATIKRTKLHLNN